jgi:DNA polymerase
VDAALTLISKETKALNAELSTLTDNCVTKATQRAKMLNWFGENGLDLNDTQKETIDGLDHTALSAPVSRAVTILRALGRSSTAKYQRMDDWMCPDARVRGGLLYHGAGTGRWSGAGVQPHNFVKGTVKDQEALWATLKASDRTQIAELYNGVMEALSNGLRGTIIAAPGKSLFVADYAAIEARVVMWLAGEAEALEMFRDGKDIYKVLASEIYSLGLDEITGPQRQLGKQGILGCGFGMGWSKFIATCAKYGIEVSDELGQQVVNAYREKYWRVKNLWYDQEAAALKAVRTKQPVECGYVIWVVEGDFLFCQLPSERRIAYPFPQIRPRETPWGEMKAALTFMGIHPITKKWVRQGTYGGSVVENMTQGIARDLLVEALLLCEQSGIFLPVLSVHDESICEADCAANLAHFTKLMTHVPKWAAGLPIAVESWVGKRYRK